MNNRRPKKSDLLQALQESEQRMADIINFLPDATLVIDLEGRVIAWNKAAEEMTGVKSEDILGKGDLEYSIMFYGDRRPILIDLVLNPVGETLKKYTSIQIRGNTLSGESFCPAVGKTGAYLRATASPLYDYKGDLAGAIESVRDATDEKNMEEELRNKQELLNAVLESTAECIITVDKNYNFLFANQAAVEYFKKNPLRVDTFKMVKNIGIEQPFMKTWMKRIKEVIATGRPQYAIDNLVAGDRLTYLESNLSPVKDKKGDYQGVVIVFRDKSVYKQIESELARSEIKYRNLVEQLPAITFIAALDDFDSIIYMSPQVKTILGFEPDVFVNNPKFWLEIVCEEDRGRVLKEIKDVNRKKAPFTTEYRITSRSGDIKWFREEARIICDKDGAPLFKQGVIFDVSEKKVAEEERLNRELEALRKKSEREMTKLRKLIVRSLLNEVGFFSDKMQEIVYQAQRYHDDRSIPILLQGETGTGKEVIAKIIHYGTTDKVSGTPFVDVNCAAIGSNIFETEFFGYEAGAFTGGLSRGQKGKFDLAQGGTLFLDEITEIPLTLQGKLLRVIEDRGFYRAGGLSKIKTDVRIICATNKDIEHSIRLGEFRKDLYFRLKVGHIHIPPLRERTEEILPLANLFLQQFSEQRGRRIKSINQEAGEMLLNYGWPGNVRELRNVIEWVTFMYDDRELNPRHLEFMLKKNKPGKEFDISIQNQISISFSRQGFNLETLNKEVIKKALELNFGNKKKTAEFLGISRTVIYNHLRKR